MFNLRFFYAILILISLAGCDDQAAKPATTQRAQQQDFQVNDVQSFQDIANLKAMLANNPNDFATLDALADLYFESGQYVDAFNTYDKAIAVNPACADCFNDRGLSLFYLGDATSALESFDKAIALKPDLTHAWLSKGFVLLSVDRYQEAVAPLNKVKELDTTGVLALQADKFLAMITEMSP
jgi:lipoprotein NlpI